MSRVLAIDTETTGLPRKDLTIGDPAQPRLVQFAALLIDADGTERAAVTMIVNPEIAIPPGASAVHGITDEIARAVGVPEKAAVGVFLRLASVADVIVAHNADFDLLQLRMAAARCNVPLKFNADVRCTCRAAEPIVNLPPTQRMIEAGMGDKPKAPKLEECVRHFFCEELTGAHDAMVDVRACVRVYRELEARGCWKEAA